MKKILVVDDDPVSRDLLKEVLLKEGFEVRLAESGEAALGHLAREDFPLVLSDIRMKQKSGFDVLRELKEKERGKNRPPVVVVLMTGFGSMEGALEALREGAFDYISKPFQLADLRTLIARAGKHAEFLRQTNLAPKSAASAMGATLAQSLIGKSPKIVEVYRTIARASLTSSSVLIAGETGTGKALVARAIHENGNRKDKAFVKVAAKEDLDALEADLAAARGGTVLVEELVAFGPGEQARILRAIESADERGFDVRWIAGSRLPTGELARSGMVRGDLLDRLHIISIEIPPLRSRLEDLPELVSSFVARYSEKNGKAISHVSESAMRKLREYPWPGNIRELERVVERAVALSAGSVLEIEDFPDIAPSAAKSEVSEPQASLESVEKAHIARVLQETGFNKSKASEILGIDRATLYRKAKLYGIDLKGKG
ncbi:MAG: sigma-54-dependent Fis family transcriptional regulator [Bdellovibrionales bacterium]|nr:sigma-54-dependent Fis family transcriptional regulator [Bdellovibrionales bacterium]